MEPDAAGSDLVVVVTAHPDVDHAELVRAAPVALDLRGATRELGQAGILQL